MLTKRLHRRDHDEAGFTLVELLIAGMIMGVVGAVVGSTIVNANRVDTKTRARAQVQSDLTTTVSRITEKLRVAAPLVALTATSATLDVYPTQPAGTTVRERYSFTVASGKVTQTMQRFSPATSSTAASTSTRVLANSIVTGPAVPFVGYTRDGVVTTQPGKAASVVITLRGRASAAAKAYDTSTTVFLRNYQG